MDKFGPYGEPAFVVSYGQSDAGKSMDALRAFPTAVFVGPPGGTKPAVTELGFRPRWYPVRSLHAIFPFIAQMQQAADDWSGLIIDDATVLTQASFQLMMESGAYRNRSGSTDIRAVYRDVGNLVVRLRSDLRNAGFHCMANFHERSPSTDDAGVFHRGGPELAARTQTKHIPHVGDLVLRAKEQPGRRPWKGVFECDPDNLQYHQKDRFGVAPRLGPLNTGELLRAAGYPLTRLPGCEWMDEAAEMLSLRIEAGTDRLEVMAEAMQKLLKAGVTFAHARWAVQDGLDRADIRMMKARERLAAVGLQVGAEGEFEKLSDGGQPANRIL